MTVETDQEVLIAVREADTEGKKRWYLNRVMIVRGLLLPLIRLGASTTDEETGEVTLRNSSRVWNPRDSVYRSVADPAVEPWVNGVPYPVYLDWTNDNVEGAYIEVHQETEVPVEIVARGDVELVLPYPGANRTGGIGSCLALRCISHSIDNAPRWRVVSRTVAAETAPG